MASRFWVGGTGTWDNSDTTHWASSSGGAGGQSVPASGDTVTFDGSSGGGTVTVAATINGSNTITNIVCGAFTGTLDFSVNNPSLTMNSMSISGSGTRTINMGSGTFTLNARFVTNMWDAGTVTNLTFNCGTSTLLLQPSGGAPNNAWGMAGGGQTYRNVTFDYSAGTSNNAFITGSNTINTLTINQAVALFPGTGTTQSLTSLVLNSAGSPGIMLGQSAGTYTVSIASGSFSFEYIAFRNCIFTGGATFAATNSWDLLGNSGITITAPSGGTAPAKVIGG